MAALVAGVQYGLSSHSNFHENKSLIFVKLTDSAQRAIEDFLRNRNKTSQNPTIQFLGNEGQLSFPSTQSSHGSAGFTFSLSGNQDIEGPQGGFECIQQTGPQSLESLGALPCKMRIQANDDVYETTRHRMAVAEENNKNKCTRVIKANGPDIGRKVKVKGTGRTIPPPSNSRHRESASIPTSNSSQLRLSSSYKPVASNPPPVRNSQPEKKVSDIMRRPLKERLIHLLALRPYKKPELYDRINREGIKERERSIITTILKQVAFMRDNTYHLHRYVWNDVQEDWPYYTEQEKAMLKRRKPQNLTPPGSSDGGSSGSGQSPNSTHPGSPPSITAPPPSLLSSKRPGYYQGNDGLPTKRPRISHYRKPEPGSSNSGSSEHGRTAASSNSNGVNSVFGGGAASGSASASSAGSGGVGSASENWEQKQQQRERRTTDYRAERTANGDVLRNSGGYAASKPCLLQSPNSPSDSEDNAVQSVHRNANATNATSNSASSQGSHNSHSNVAHNSNSSSSSGRHSHHHHHHHGNASGGNSAGGKSTVGSVNNAGDSNTATAASAVDYNNTRNVSSAANSAGDRSGSASRATYADRRDRTDRNDRTDRTDRLEREQHVERVRDTRPVARPNAYNDVSNVPATNGDQAVTSSSIDLEAPESPDSTEYPDYLTYYTTISSQEQRRRYKAEFNADYEEYRKLHALVVKVTNRFAQLEERLRQEQNSQNWRAVEEIKAQIMSEYDMTKKDPVHIATKRRFHYLHEKLSHIKRLVYEYDSQHYTDGKTANTGDNNSKGIENGSGRNGTNDIDNLHY